MATVILGGLIVSSLTLRSASIARTERIGQILADRNCAEQVLLIAQAGLFVEEPVVEGEGVDRVLTWEGDRLGRMFKCRRSTILVPAVRVDTGIAVSDEVAAGGMFRMHLLEVTCGSITIRRRTPLEAL